VTISDVAKLAGVSTGHRVPLHQQYPVCVQRDEREGLPGHRGAGIHTGRFRPQFPHGKKKIIGFIVPDIANKFFATMN